MATEAGIPDSMPDDAQIARFTRLTTKISFKNGSEETIEYDERVPMRDDEIHFRRYTERNSDQPLAEGKFDLKEELKPRTILRYHGYPREAVQYRKFIDAQRLYLVTYDEGRSVRIVKPEELPRISTASQQLYETPAEPSPEPETEEVAEVGDWEEPEPVGETEVGDWEEDEPEEPAVGPDEAADEYEEAVHNRDPEPDEEMVEASVGTWEEDEDEEDEEAEPAEA